MQGASPGGLAGAEVQETKRCGQGTCVVSVRTENGEGLGDAAGAWTDLSKGAAACTPLPLVPAHALCTPLPLVPARAL